MELALEAIVPNADRWVLVDAVETVARLLVAAGETSARPLLDDAPTLRADIRQPVAPTERADVDATRMTVASERRLDAERGDAAAVYAAALQRLYRAADPPQVPIPLREVGA